METSDLAGISGSVSMKSIRLTVSENIQEQQKCGVASNYEEYLKDPTFEVLPRMQEIEVKDFYDGRYADETDYRPRPGYGPKVERKTDKLVDMKSLFSSFDQTQRTTRDEKSKEKNSVDHVMIVGPAGSGKSTIMRRFAREADKGNIPQIAKDCFVHYLDARRFDPSEKIDQHEFIFRNMSRELSDDKRKEAYGWMKGHPDEVVLVVDSLDTLGYELENASDGVGPDERAVPADILRNIFMGNIFPRCKIVSSSREHQIRNYQEHLRPGRIVSLAGLTQESIKKLTFGFLDGKDAEQVFQRLQATPELMILCETPIFLVFSVIAFQDIDSTFIPKTMTGVMVKLLQSLLHSKHARVLQLDILKKMKQLSYHGTVEGKVLFTKDDLDKVEVKLSKKDVTNLTITVPGPRKSRKEQKVLDGDRITYFAHQSIEEMLCAMYVAEMRAKEFRAFVKEKLHQPRYCVVRRMLCGLVLDPDVREQSKSLTNEATSEKHRDILIQSVKRKLQETVIKFPQFAILGTRSQQDQLELFYSAKEAGQAMGDVIPDYLGHISITSPSALDIHTIGTVLCHQTRVESLRMKDCASLREGLCQLETDKFKSKPIGAKGMRLLGHIVKQCQVTKVEFERCNLSFVDIQTFFKDIIEKARVSNYKVQSTGRDKKTLLQSTSDVIELSSRDADPENATVSWLQLHNDTSNHEQESNKVHGWVIDLIECNDEITCAKLEEFEKVVTNSKVTKMSFKEISNWKRSDLDYIGRLVTRCGVQDLQFQDCTLNRHLLQALQASLQDYELTTMSFWGNRYWEPDDLSCIGKIVAQCGVQDLQFWGCALNTQSLQEFQASVENSKMEKLSFLGFKDIKPDHLSWIGKIVAQCGVQDLRLGCNPNADLLKAFKSSLEDSQMRTLEFGSISPPEAASDELVDVISHLVSNIRERLLTDLRLSWDQTCVLEKRLLDVASNELQIGFDNQVIDGKVLHDQADALKKGLENAEDSSDLINVLRKHEKDSPAVISACVRSIAIEDHELGKDGMETIGNIINCCDELERIVFAGCQLCISSLQRLNNIVRRSKCRKTKLTISETDNIGILFPEICELVSSLEIPSLDITSNNITYSEVEKLSQALDTCQVASLNELDISYNTGIRSDGYKTLGVIAQKISLKKIRMVDCKVTDDDIEQFWIGLERAKLDELNISCNILLTASGFETIARLATECQLQCLKMSSCAITEKELQGFNGALSGTSKLKVLDVGYNTEMGASGLKVLGQTVQKCNVQELNIAGCRVTDERVAAFRGSVGQHKLEALNLEDNFGVGRGIVEVAKMVEQCKLQKLNISDCMLMPQELSDFKAALGSSKLLVLDLSDHRREADRGYINAVCQLLPFVEELLVLRFWKISGLFIETIQKELDKSQERKLKVDPGDHGVIDSGKQGETTGEPERKKSRLEN